MDKIVKLQQLKEKMIKDETLPLRKTATNLVFGEGNPEAEIYFLGEAPGFYEDQQGRPFVGAAGKLLNQALDTINLKRNQVYISNVVRFRPPNNRDPLPEEINAFSAYVDSEIEIINPKLIVTLGRFSMGKFLPNEKISQIHGKPRRVQYKNKDILIIPMFHPAAALRSEEIMEKFKEDFKRIPDILNKEKVTTKPTQGSLF